MPKWDVNFNVKVDIINPAIVQLVANVHAFSKVIRNIPIPPAAQRHLDALNIMRAVRGTTGIEGTELSVYWALVPFPVTDNVINGPTNKYRVHINLDSTDPCMLVYVYAKSENSETADYDMKVPPTNPGFMVPEPATIAAIATPTLSLLGYAYYKRKTFFS